MAKSTGKLNWQRVDDIMANEFSEAGPPPKGRPSTVRIKRIRRSGRPPLMGCRVDSPADIVGILPAFSFGRATILN